MEKTVRDFMTPNPRTLPRTATVTEAARIMRDDNIGDVLVAENDRLFGILTDRDIVIRAVCEGKDPDQVTVGDLCTTDVITVSPDDGVDIAVKAMTEQALRRLPCVENDRIVGIVSLGDLAERLDPDSALASISSAPPDQ
jgi:CBS domain-containing protein